jgi:hypothetical protein
LKHKDDSQDLPMRYLLGQLSESEQERIEQTYLADESWQERLAVAEDDLIDDYVRGRLGASDRTAFESHFLNSPRRHERVAFARALQQLTRPTPAVALVAPPSPWRWRERPAMALLVAATVLLLIGGAWLAFQSVRLRGELTRAQAERAALADSEEQLRRQLGDEHARNEDLSQQLAEAHPEPPPQTESEHTTIQPPAIASFVLSAGLARDPGERQMLDVPRTAQQVRLQLAFRQPGPAADAGIYRAVLRTPEGREVLRRDGLKARPAGAARLVALPPTNLASGDYLLTLESRNAANGYDVVAEYAFTVTRK